MSEVQLSGRGLIEGMAEGQALVTSQPISGWGGVDPKGGKIIESGHELCGQSFAGKVLVFPGAKGSSGWSGAFHLARLAGSCPLALIFNSMSTKVALGVVVTRVPAVCDLDADPIELIETGDWVSVDGGQGLVVVHKQPATGSPSNGGPLDAQSHLQRQK